MHLRYNGVRAPLTLKSPNFVGGPYVVEGNGAVFEIDPADFDVLMENNVRAFTQVPAPVVEAPKKFKCPECDKEYATEVNLNKHIEAMHPATE